MASIKDGVKQDKKVNPDLAKTIQLVREKKHTERVHRRKQPEELLFQEKALSCFDGAFTALFATGTK